MLEIKKYTPTSHKIKAVIYGASGSGKTTFAGTAKDAIFLSAEGGLLSIANKGVSYVEIKSLQDLRDMEVYLRTKPHSFKTVIIDSITEINDIIKSDIEKKTGRAMQLQDWGVLAKEIKKTLRNFRDLPLHVVFIAQEAYDEKDENGTATKIIPSLNGKASTEIAYFMDIVGYVFVNKQGEHKIITNSNAKLLTKDRSGLIGNDTEADFEVWVEKVSSIKISEEKVVDTINSETQQNQTQTPPTKPLPPKNRVSKTPYEMAKMSAHKISTKEQAESILKNIQSSDKYDAREKIELEEIYKNIIAKLS